MTWWVLTYLNNTRDWTSLFTWASTNVPDHLFMSWAYWKPTRKAIWRVVRGKTVFCGWQYVWDTPNVSEQTESGDTYHHTWHLANLESDQHIWYYLHAPGGPYGMEIQGPLMHIPPPEAYLWTTRMYVATKAKGIYYTDTFSGPGGAPPVWKTRNGGLLSLAIWQLHPDPLGAEYRHYCIAGPWNDRTLYRRIPAISEAWIPILTTAQAWDIAGPCGRIMRWVTTNINHPGHLYVLACYSYADPSVCLLRSTDYGETWAAFPIFAYPYAHNAGNLSTGILQGVSPHPPGDVIYATVNHDAGGGSYIYRSYDNGDTWSIGGSTGTTLTTPRCLVDPTDQSIVYMGGYASEELPCRLFRSASHGGVWVNISDPHKLGAFIDPTPASLWIDPTDHESLRVLQLEHVWNTPDSGLTWEDWGATQYQVRRHTSTWEQPSRLYLARNTNAVGPPISPLNHVIYVSDTHGIYMEGKAGENCALIDGGGDSIPWNCGGVSLEGMMLLPP